MSDEVRRKVASLLRMAQNEKASEAEAMAASDPAIQAERLICELHPWMVGKDAFRDFMAHMNRCYRETLTDIVIMSNDDGTRGSAEFVVNGQYLASDEGLPEANGQTYVLPAGAFFEIRDGKVARILVSRGDSVAGGEALIELG